MLGLIYKTGITEYICVDIFLSCIACSSGNPSAVLFSLSSILKAPQPSDLIERCSNFTICL